MMTTEKISFLTVFHKYMLYSEAFSQYNRLDEEDRKIIQPYIDRLKEEWQQDLASIRLTFQLPLLPEGTTGFL